jgi:DNA-binding PadR family transcriptional regulator
MHPSFAPPLSPAVYNVLLALGGETLHGYAIMRRLQELTNGREQLLPGSLYVTLARMHDAGLLEAVRAPRDAEPSGGPPRRHYRVSPKGAEAARAESERLRRLLAVARRRNWLPEHAR